MIRFCFLIILLYTVTACAEKTKKERMDEIEPQKILVDKQILGEVNEIIANRVGLTKDKINDRTLRLEPTSMIPASGDGSLYLLADSLSLIEIEKLRRSYKSSCLDFRWSESGNYHYSDSGIIFISMPLISDNSSVAIQRFQQVNPVIGTTQTYGIAVYDVNKPLAVSFYFGENQ